MWHERRSHTTKNCSSVAEFPVDFISTGRGKTGCKFATADGYGARFLISTVRAVVLNDPEGGMARVYG